MKTHQEAWKALEDGHVLVDDRDGQEVHLVDGNVTDVRRGVVTSFIFANPQYWRIKPKKLPFVEALRALVNGECSAIRRDDLADITKLTPVRLIQSSDFDAEWELVK